MQASLGHLCHAPRELWFVELCAKKKKKKMLIFWLLELL